MSEHTHVLCVHADSDVRERIASALTAPNRTVETVGSIAAVQDRISGVDCLVTGQELGDGTGVDLLESIRKEHPYLPVVVVPTSSDEPLASAAFAADATDYLPLSADGFDDRLVAAVTGALERRTHPQAERYRALIEHSTDLVSILGPDGTFQYVSPSVEEILGYPPEDLLGEVAFEFVHEEDRDDVVEKFFSAIQDPADQPEAEFRFRTADGDWRFIEARGKNRLDHPGVEGFVVNGRDVTERHRREEELQTARALTEGILQTIPDLVYAFDRDGKPIRDDLVLADIPGYSNEELVERDPLEFVPEEDRDMLADAIGSVFEEGEVETVESAIVTADGEAIPHEFNGAALTDKDGNVRGLVGVARDISERKAREKELELYETMVDVVGDGVFATDEEGRIITVNHRVEEMTGFSADELIGEGPRPEILPPEYLERVEDIVDDLLEGDQRVATLEHPVYTKNDERLICETRLTLLPTDESGQFRGVVGSSRDITTRKKRQRERERQNERLEEFTAVVSHDLRNPLNVITGHLELARKTGGAEHFQAIQAATERMEALITDLLSLARQGRTIGEVEPVDLEAVARNAWESVDTGPATLTIDGRRTMTADGERLCELFENLFRNAVEHGLDGRGELTVTVGPLPDGFYVADDGSGIPADERDQVLEHGYTTTEDGTGLGLAIVETIAEAHGWELRVTASETGGARFEVVDVEGPEPEGERAPISS